MRLLLASRLAVQFLFAGLMFPQNTPEKLPELAPPSASETQAALDRLGKETQKPLSPITKLDPPLEAVARAWRRLGIKGATQECQSRNIKLDRLRLPAVIHVTSAKQMAEVEKALRRAWGEVLSVDQNSIHAWLPVPALRRISLMNAVESIYLDQILSPVDSHSKEKLR